MLLPQIAQHLGRTAFAALLTLGATLSTPSARSTGPDFVVASNYEPSANVPGALGCAGRDFCMQVASSTLSDAFLPTPTVLVTRNGGTTWRPTSPLPVSLAVAPVLGVACTAPGVCVVGGGGTVARTTNGGGTWRLRSGFRPSWQLGVNVACLGNGACVGIGAVAKHKLGTEWLGTRSTRAVTLHHSGELPDGFSPRSISCPSSSRCVATGALKVTTGVVLAATALGATLSWREVRVMPHWVIEAVSCPTNSVCLGVQARVLRAGHVSFDEFVRSNDGGSTWRGVARFVGPFLPSAVSCAAAAVCAASVGPGSGASIGGVVTINVSSRAASVASVSSFTTTNGGRTWHRHVVLADVPVPSAVTGGASCLIGGVCVADASGPNGGRTVAGPSGGELTTDPTVSRAIGDTSLACTSGETCYRVDEMQGVTGYASTLLVSHDDGLGWVPVTLPTGDEPVEVGGCQGPEVCEVIALRGVVLRDREQGNFDYGASSVVDLTTTDGGASWSSSIIEGRNEVPQAASCSSTMQCSVAITPANSSGDLYLLSTQNGATWTRTPVPGSGASPFSGAIFGPTVDLTCGQGGTCLFSYSSDFGGLPTMLRSSDGGASWVVATPPGTELLGVSCFGASTCLSAYTNQPPNSYSSNEATYLAESPDGGATWSTPMPVPTRLGEVTSVTCASTLDCTALYDDAAVQTTNSGDTWTAVGWPKEPPLTLSFPLEFSCSLTTCLAVESSFSLSFSLIRSSTTLLRLAA